MPIVSRRNRNYLGFIYEYLDTCSVFYEEYT